MRVSKRGELAVKRAKRQLPSSRRNGMVESGDDSWSAGRRARVSMGRLIKAIAHEAHGANVGRRWDGAVTVQH